MSFITLTFGESGLVHTHLAIVEGVIAFDERDTEIIFVGAL